MGKRYYYSDHLAAVLLIMQGGVHSIIKRDNIPFMWPESEEVNDQDSTPPTHDVS